MIKNNLKHILVDENMSIMELARRIGITYSIVYDFANMKRQSAQWRVIDAICKELGIQPGDMLVFVDEGEDAKKPY
jgi:putative transcriptional regulator